MANLKLPELDTRSILDVVEENFERVNLKTYAIRMIYCGEHGLTKKEFIKQFGNTIHDTNSGYCDIQVNGLLLVYDSYFVHIIEGSEDTIHRQLRFLFDREEYWVTKMKQQDVEDAEKAKAAAEAAILEDPDFVPDPIPDPASIERIMFRRLKMLMVYHSITTLLFDNWRAVEARPPSLVGKLDIYAPLPDHLEQLRICLNKIFNLCDLARTDDELSFEGLSATDPKTGALPEVALLDFLIQSQYTLDLRYVSYLHRRVDDYFFYFEYVWPLANHFTPRYLYKLKIDDTFVDPLPVMPWEVKVKDEDEEKEDGQKSSSSDSD